MKNMGKHRKITKWQAEGYDYNHASLGVLMEHLDRTSTNIGMVGGLSVTHFLSLDFYDVYLRTHTRNTH